MLPETGHDCPAQPRPLPATIQMTNSRDMDNDETRHRLTEDGNWSKGPTMKRVYVCKDSMVRTGRYTSCLKEAVPPSLDECGQNKRTRKQKT